MIELLMFSMDSPVVKAFTRLGELILLNLLFLFSCIPIITIGAASVALYDACFRLGSKSESSVCGAYFRAFKSNFKQATICWLILLAFFAGVCLTALLTVNKDGVYRYISMVALIVMIIQIMETGYIFPLISRFQSNTKNVLKNGFILSVVYFPRSICIMVLNSLPFVSFFIFPGIFLLGTVFWLFLYFAVATFINTRLLHKVFAPGIQEKDEEENNAIEDWE